MRRFAALLVPLLAGAALAPAAPAATVTATSERGLAGYPRSYEYLFTHVRVTAAGGESNRLAVSNAGRAIEVRDSGAPLSAGPGCSAGPNGAVRCDTIEDRGAKVSVLAGDGDDVVDAGALPAAPAFVSASIDGGAGADRLVGGPQHDGLDGGPGDDRLEGGVHVGQYGPTGDAFSGGAGDDRLIGGPGGDSVAGGPGADVIEAGPGNDRLWPDDAEVGSDVVDGGEGLDSLSYAERPSPVSVDLGDPAPDGGAGERDVLRGVENLTGGKGRDRLAGDDGPNTLEGAPTFDVLTGDRLEGRGGADRLNGGLGDDTLLGGPGDDSLDGRTGDNLLDGGDGDDGLGGGFPPDSSSPRATLRHVRCGSGVDVLTGAPPLTVIPHDCERIGLSDVDIELLAVNRESRRLRFRLRGDDDGFNTPCRVRATAGRSPAVVSTDDGRPHRLTVGYRRRPGGTALVRFEYVVTGCPRGARYRRLRTLRFRLGRDVVATGAQVPPGATLVVRTGAPTKLSAYGGVLVWSQYSPRTKRFRLMARRGGRTERLPVPSSPDPLDLDLGPGPDGRPVAVYSRCARGGFACDVFRYSFARRAERRVESVSTATSSERLPTVWRDRLGFARTRDRRAYAVPGLYVQRDGRRSRRVAGGTIGKVLEEPHPLGLDLRGDRLGFLWEFVAKSEACGEGGKGTALESRELWVSRPGDPRRLFTTCTPKVPQYRVGPVFEGRYLYSAFLSSGFAVQRVDRVTGEVTTARIPGGEDTDITSIGQWGPTTYFSTIGTYSPSDGSRSDPAIFEARLRFVR